MNKNTITPHAAIPFWRDVRALRVISQIVFLIAVAAVLWWLFNNLQTNLRAIGLNISFNFLGNTAGFPISEGISYFPTDSNAYAFWVGVVNTLKVISIGIVLATVVGTVVGIARLSSNWVVQKVATLYVEILRNIPLLVQLFFWYFAVMLVALPLVNEAIALPGNIFLSRRGLNFPWPLPTAVFDVWLYWLSGGAALAVGVYFFRRIQLKRADRPGFPFLWAFTVFLLLSALGWLLTPGVPLVWEIPVFERFNFRGGMELTAPFMSLLIALIMYTGAFIAEIVRAGIQSVSKGQNEAARALGLNGAQVLRLVVLPQALRVIIPPLASQYLNLTKNSSLAIVIGYYDLVNVGTTIFNQTGRAVEMILLIMVAYLSMSLLTSMFMNYYNRRIRLVEH